MSLVVFPDPFSWFSFCITPQRSFVLSAKNVLQYSVEGRCQFRAMQIVKLSFTTRITLMLQVEILHKSLLFPRIYHLKFNLIMDKYIPCNGLVQGCLLGQG